MLIFILLIFHLIGPSSASESTGESRGKLLKKIIKSGQLYHKMKFYEKSSFFSVYPVKHIQYF